MEWIGVGVAAFILLVCNASYPKKIRQLERKVKKLEKKQNQIVKLLRIETVDEIEVTQE